MSVMCIEVGNVLVYSLLRTFVIFYLSVYGAQFSVQYPERLFLEM